MGLPWVRLDTSIPDNPKFLQLIEEHRDRGYKAAWVWVCSMTFAGKHETDGFIPHYALRAIYATKKDAEILVNARLWDIAVGGWRVHDWEAFQLSSNESQARREKAQRAAQARWAVRS